MKINRPINECHCYNSRWLKVFIIMTGAFRIGAAVNYSSKNSSPRPGSGVCGFGI